MKKNKGSPLFRLRPDPLRWSIAGVLLWQPMLAVGSSVVPVPGPGGTAVVTEHNGIPVIAIGAPNLHGLSHNQFSDYNVPVQGLVLNNAVAPGDSVLAGPLSANPQFNGQAATTILNEVVGQLPSNVLGTQEVFGQAADYVLANPNGIHVQGVGFINTPQAVFLVGTPEVQDGRLTGLNTFTAPGDLRITGAGLSTAAAVGLIAPRIDSQGQLQAGAALTAVAGRNRVSSDTLDILESRQPAGEAPGIDLNVLGAMRAGRIRMVSTREGAGIRLAGPEVKGDEVNLTSAGDLVIGRGAGAGRTLLAATKGELRLNAAQDITISGSRMVGRDIRVQAGRDLTLDAATREKLEERRQAWNKKAWFITTETYTQDTKRTRTQLEGNTLTAAQSAEFTAGRDLKLRATSVQAEQALSLKAGKHLTIEGGVEHTTHTQETHHRKHLWRGDSKAYRIDETLSASELSGGSITLEAGAKATIRGSDLTTPGDLSIRGQSIAIDTQGLKRVSSQENYRGDLTKGFFFGNDGDRQETGTRHRGSDLRADGTVSMVSDDVLIRGSKVEGKQGTRTIGEKEAVIIDSVVDVTHISERRDSTQVGGIFGSKRQHTQTREQAVGSRLSSEGDQMIVGATTVRVEGSRITTPGAVKLEGKDQVALQAYKATSKETDTTSAGALTAKAGETRPGQDGKKGSMQYYAAVGYERTTHSSENTQATHLPSMIEAGTVSMVAPTVDVMGSSVSTTKGNIDVQATNLNVVSQRDETGDLRENGTSGGGLKLGGGLERVGSAFEGHYQNDSELAEKTQIARAALRSTGDINLEVTERINYKGAQVEAAGKVNETATQIHREDIKQVTNLQKESVTWQGELGASLETKDLINPIRKAIEGGDQARFARPGVEDALVPPSLGGDGSVAHSSQAKGTRTEQPEVTTLRGKDINTDVAGLLYDKGTRYEASEGKPSIKAGSHEAPAAYQTTDEHTRTVNAEAGLRVDTVTGNDVNVTLRGNGGSVTTVEKRDTPVPASFLGKRGVAIQLGADGRYEGVTIDTGEGPLDINGEGHLNVAQAQSRQYTEQHTTQGYGLLKAGTAPTGQNGLFMGALDHNTLTTTDTQGVGGIIKTPTGTVKVPGNVELQGVAINNGYKATEHFKVIAGGKAEHTATVDTHSAQGQQLGGALQLSLSRNPAADAQRKGGGIGGHIDIGRVDEQAETRKGAPVKVTDLSITSQAHEAAAIHMEGTQLAGERLQLSAPNGGIHIEAARSEEHKDNLRIAAGAEVNGSRGLNKDDDASALYARAKVDVDRVESTTYANADVRAKALTLESAMDTRLEGAIVAADTVRGTVAGDLVVSSLKDQVSSTQVKVDARFGKENNPQGLLNGLSAVTGPLADKAKEKIGKPLQAIDPKLSPTLLVDVVNEQRDQVAKAAMLSGREGIALEVAGTTELIGAKLRSTQGRVELGGSDVRLTHLSGTDYRADLSLNASTGPAELLTNVISELTTGRSELAKADEHGNLGVIRTGGHDRQHTLNAAVEEQR